MTIVNWDNDVNRRILRNSSWDMPTRFIADKTRSGVRKVRMANVQEPTTFSIKMRFNILERKKFMDWFENVTLSGTLAFWFRDITKETNKTFAYRFVEGTKIGFSNQIGTLTDVSMSWEKVEGVERDGE